jgi:hypothetical protein
MDKSADSMASQLILPKKNVTSVFFLKKLEGNVLWRYIYFIEPYVLFRVVLNTEYTVIVPG